MKRRWDWHGAVALVLAVSLGTCLVILMAHWALSDKPLGTSAATALATTLGAVLGAVTTYLGRGYAHRDDRDREHTASE